MIDPEDEPKRTHLPASGWYADPEMTDTQRYWDGSQWTEHRAPGSPDNSRSALPSEIWFGVGACVLMIVGAAGPWVNAGFITVGGLNGDGLIVLGAAVAGFAGCAFAAQQRQRSPGGAAVWTLLAGLAGAATAIYDLVQIYGEKAELLGETVRIGAPGWGLWLAAAASMALCVSAVTFFSLGSNRGRAA